eukprot:scaffold100633_cov89-Phaeocystis_antarctica.AAC.1
MCLSGAESAVHTLQVRAGDSRGVRRRMLAVSVRTRCDRLNGTMHEVYRCLLGIRLASRMLKTRCRRPTACRLPSRPPGSFARPARVPRCQQHGGEMVTHCNGEVAPQHSSVVHP